MTKLLTTKLALPLVMILAIGTITAAYAAIVVTNDDFYTTGKKYWGEKPNNNSYSGTKSFFCRNTSGGLNSGCTSLIDTRTNYVRHTTQLSANTGATAWQSALQGTDPWGFADNTSGGASIHNTNFPRVAVDDYKLSTQYAWFKAAQFADSVPSGLATNGAVDARLLTDLWFKHKTNSNVLVVIDFSWTDVTNQNGAWIKDPKTIGQPYSPIHVSRNPNNQNQCIYHYNVVADTNQNENVWRQATRNIKSDIQSALTSTYADYTSGFCSTTVPGGTSSGTNFDLVDIETGIEVEVASQAIQNWGTLVGAYSQSKLEDTT